MRRVRSVFCAGRSRRWVQSAGVRIVAVAGLHAAGVLVTPRPAAVTHATAGVAGQRRRGVARHIVPASAVACGRVGRSLPHAGSTPACRPAGHARVRRAARVRPDGRRRHARARPEPPGGAERDGRLPRSPTIAGSRTVWRSSAPIPSRRWRPFRAALDDTTTRPQPSDWLEALTKAYVGDSIADDFVREVARGLSRADRDLVLEVLHDSRYADFAAAEIRQALAGDPRVGQPAVDVGPAAGRRGAAPGAAGRGRAARPGRPARRGGPAATSPPCSAADHGPHRPDGRRRSQQLTCPGDRPSTADVAGDVATAWERTAGSASAGGEADRPRARPRSIST